MAGEFSWQGAFPNASPTAPALDFGERTMHIDGNCGLKCDAEGTAQQYAALVGQVDGRPPTVIFDFMPICADCIQVLPAVIISK